MRKFRRMLKRISALDVVICLILIGVFVVTFYPFFYTMFMAAMPYENYLKEAVHVWPSGFTFDNIRQVLTNASLLAAFRNSALRTVIGTFFGVIVTIMTGYVLAQPQLPGGRVINKLFVFPMYFAAGIIPYYLTINVTGLLGSFWAMIIPCMITPFNMFIARSNFKSYPAEIIEAAKIDGANDFKLFWRVVWPTSRPLVATQALLIGAFHWNDFFWPSIIVSPKWQPAPVLLNNIVSAKKTLAGLGIGNMVQTQSYISAVAAVLIIPIIVVYPFVQKFLIKGVMMGSVKE